jgi:hypothetical protein
MKNQLLRLALCAFLLATIIVSCKKSDKTDNPNFDTEAAAQSDDESNFAAQLESVSTETDIILQSSSSYAGRLTDLPGVCNATFAMDTSGNPRTITITYNGSNCFGTHTRTGTVVASMATGTRWKNAGAVITLTYTNLVITRLIDNKSITINGSHTLTNVSGGLLINLPVLGPVTHAINSAGMSVKFGDNTERTWQVARQRVFTYNNGVVVTVTGTHTEGNVTGIAEWGINRFGRQFTSIISQPLVFRQDCSFRLTSGQIQHTVPVFNATATFGLNAAGNPTGCPGAGLYYCKVIWTGPNNNSHTVIFPY